MTERFIESWGRLIADEPGRQIEVGNNHPLNLFYGSDQGGRLLFFVISETKPGLVKLSDAVAIDRGIRKLDGRWTLSLTLRDRRFADEFMRLGDDLVDSSREGRNEAHALQLLSRAVEQWRALFALSAGEHLPLPAIRGLVGELWFGFFQIAASVPPSTVVHAWTGPFGSPQDFNLPSGESYEVKTIRGDSTTIRISSAEQLDPSVGSLELAVVTATDVEQSSLSAVSLPLLVSQVEALLSEHVADIDEFHAKIRSLGVDLGDTYYEDYWFRIDRCSTYRVDISFPSIRRSTLDPAVDNVRYEVLLHGIADHLVSTWDGDAAGQPEGDS